MIAGLLLEAPEHESGLASAHSGLGWPYLETGAPFEVSTSFLTTRYQLTMAPQWVQSGRMGPLL